MPFDDVAEPVARLTSPTERTEEILGQPFSNPGSILDWTSPTYIVNEFVKQVIGYDIFEEAAKAFSGDWEAVWQAAGAFRNLGSAIQDIGMNVAHGAVELDGHWDGNAADGAYTFFTGLSGAISSQKIALDTLADSYEKAAEGTYRLADAAAGILRDIGDAAMVGAVAASAGTATIETGVGFVSGWGIAAYEAYKIAELADKAKKIIATATALIGTAVGEIQAASTQAGILAKYPLPGSGYQHPSGT